MAINQSLQRYFNDVMAEVDMGGLTPDQAFRMIYDQARSLGVSSQDVSDSTGVPLADVNAWVSNSGLTPLSAGDALAGAPEEAVQTPVQDPAPQEEIITPVAMENQGITDDDIRRTYDELIAQGLTGDDLNRTIYDTAIQYGVSGDRIAEAIGESPWNMYLWAKNSGLEPLDTRILGDKVEGQAVTNEQIQQVAADFEAMGLSPEAIQRGIYEAASYHDVGADQISEALNIPMSDITAWTNANNVAPLRGQVYPSNPAPNSGETFTDADINQYIQDLQNQGLQGEDLQRAIYDAAQRGGVSDAQLSRAMGIPIADIQTWTRDRNLRELGAPEYGLAATRDSFDRARGFIEEGHQQGRTDLDAARFNARNELVQGLQTGRSDIQTAADDAAYRQNVYEGQGRNAFNVQAALSGAMGPEAQQQAYDNFISSPGQQWLQEQGERALTRNAAALGGLGGGNVRQELVRQGQGMAQQDFGNYYNRLQQLGAQGQRAAENVSNIHMNRGQNLANIATSTGQGLANIEMNTGQNLANLTTGAAGNMANLETGLGQYQYQAGQDIASQLAGMSSNLANVQQQMGQTDASIYGGTTQNLANIYGQTGNTLGQLPLTAANYLSGMDTQYGRGVGGMFSELGANEAGAISAAMNAYSNFLSGLEI